MKNKIAELIRVARPAIDGIRKGRLHQRFFVSYTMLLIIALCGVMTVCAYQLLKELSTFDIRFFFSFAISMSVLFGLIILPMLYGAFIIKKISKGEHIGEFKEEIQEFRKEIF